MIIRGSSSACVMNLEKSFMESQLKMRGLIALPSPNSRYLMTCLWVPALPAAQAFVPMMSDLEMLQIL